MAIVLVAHVGLTPSGNAGGTTSGITTTGANLICVSISHYAPGGSVVLSDSKGNSYTLARNQNDNTTVSAVALYYVLNPTVGSGHTFTVSISGATGYPSMTVEAFSGVNTSVGLDQINSSGTATTGSITPGANNSLVVSGASVNGTTSGQTFSVNSSLSIQDQTPFLSGSYFGNASAYIVQGAAAAINATWSYSGAQTMASAIMSFWPSVDASSVGSAAGTSAASAISANTSSVSGTAAGAGIATGISVGGQQAVGTAVGIGVANAVSLIQRTSIGSAVGIGAAVGISPILKLAVGSAVGAGVAGATSTSKSFAAGYSSGRGSARGIGRMVGRSLPFNIDRAWAIDINGSIIDAAQYDPITHTLRVIYVPPLAVDVGNQPTSITNTIQSSADPQAYVLALVASAAN